MLTPQQIEQYRKQYNIQTPQQEGQPLRGQGLLNSLKPVQVVKEPSGIEGYIKGLPGRLVEGAKNVGQQYKQTAEDLVHGIPQAAGQVTRGIDTRNPLEVLGGLEKGIAKPVASFASSVFAPLTEGARALVPGEGARAAFGQGATLGGVVSGTPGGAVLGGLGGVALHAINELKKNPKVAPILEKHPDLEQAFNDAVTLGVTYAGMRGAEKVGGPKDLLNKPITEVPGQALKNVAGVVKPATDIALGAVQQTSKLVGTAIPGASKLASTLARYGTSQATGMSPETISRIISNPQDFSPEAMKQFTREGVAARATSAIESRLNDLSETGREYQGVRESKSPVNIPMGTFEGVLSKHGIGVDAEGKLTFGKESTPTSRGDRAALQDWYNTYGKETSHTSNSLLNARKGLDNLAQFDTSKTDAANVLARDLRKSLNEVGRPQVKGLEELDTKFSTEVSELKQVKKDYFNSDGTLKDNAISKIANLSNKGRESVLERLEKVSPGIGEQVRTLKAVEDIQAASGQKVGAYARGIVPGLVGYSAGGLVGGIVSAILTSPSVATKILRGYGKLLGTKDAILNKVIKDYEKNVSPTKRPSTAQPSIKTSDSNMNHSITNGEPNVKSGLAMKDISKIHPDDVNTLLDYVDYADGTYKPSPKELNRLEGFVDTISEEYGIPKRAKTSTQANAIQDFLKKIGKGTRQDLKTKPLYNKQDLKTGRQLGSSKSNK